MKLLTHPATTSLGLTSLYLLSLTGQLVAPGHNIIYHWSGSATDLFLPVLIDFSVLWLVLFLFLSLARKAGRLSVAIWSGLVLPLPWVLLKNWQSLSGETIPLRLNALLLGLTVAGFVLVVATWTPAFAPIFERVRGLAATTIGFAAIVALFTLSQLFWLGWKSRDLNAPRPLHQPVAVSSPPKTRIIWILFDELSYQQVYERRFPGLQLPAFDRLASQATLFTHTVPAGTRTEMVIPSLFTGQPVDNIRASSDGRQLFLHNPGVWMSFDPRGTVFQDALNGGYSTAIAGWYNPYCRIMPQVLDQCFWTFNTSLFGGMSPRSTVEENVLTWVYRKISGVQSLFRLLSRSGPAFDPQSSMLHIMDYTRIDSSADRLLEDRSAGFVFLHMPVPHPNGIYNRVTGEFATTHSTYIDNLALADRYLAHVRAVLEQNGTWDNSVVVVMADHSWRTSFMWRLWPAWTSEENVASRGGQFDDRPTYIVKLPYQQQPARIDVPYEAIHTRALFDALIAGQVQSPDGLSAWTATWRARDMQKVVASR